ncbi:hypothetical protein EYW49_17610 [Siculibacillus lacustris]|uniref:Uncharacterized protein n=1 Tax=Siculibacillus lacustris TaxID=1549641 RepID=A0A4Q9VJV4_9HYPH|nr:hypothetical protein [Siculibacillus lacustris]TBW34738.1 hypothetical protein EYW49_17610 [Siculibacillus lacustris]
MTGSVPRPDRRRRRLAASVRIGAALCGLALLVGCGAAGTSGDAGSVLSGETRLPPLKAQPPAGMVTVQMLPFTGVPVTIGDGIYTRFRMQAPGAGITLVHRLEEPATYRIQGHFVALGNNTATTFLFTYDIYDASGRRVQRIIGQELGNQAEGDAWAGMTVDGQTRLASRAVRAIKAWLTRADG